MSITSSGIEVTGNIEKTGSVSFIETHPNDSTKEIVYYSLEAGEVGVYTRGSAQLTSGYSYVDLPEHFSLVTATEGITVQLTPRGECNGLYVVDTSPEQVIVKELLDGTSNVEFYYIVHGLRKGYEDKPVIRDKVQD